MLADFVSTFLRPARCGAFAVLCCSACTSSVGLDSPPVGDAAMTAVDRVIGVPACSTDVDCRTVALGEKACGGPLLYRAWSLRRTDSKALVAAAARYAATQGARLDASGMVSNCALVADPGARCVVSTAADAASAGSMGQPGGRCELARGHGNAAR